MKRKLTKAEYDLLPDVLKNEYEEKNGNYLAKIEDDDDAILALKNAKENEANSHKETKKRLKELEDKLNANDEENNRKNGDVSALDKSWQEKFNKRESELTAERDKLRSTVINSRKDSILSDLAAKLSKSDSVNLFKKGIKDRIAVEFDGETVTHRILGIDGKVSAMTLEDFEKEIVADKEFSSIIVASKASGTGSSDTSKLSSGGTQTNNEKPNYAEMKPSAFAGIIEAKLNNK